MTYPDHPDHDPDAALMQRASAIAQEERQACAANCPDSRLCELVARLAVRVARAEAYPNLCDDDDGPNTERESRGLPRTSPRFCSQEDSR